MIEVGSVEHIFEISGRCGLTIAPGIKNGDLTRTIRVGDEIIIVNPDMSQFETTIFGVEMLNTGKPVTHTPINLPKDISKDDIKPGARIYILDQPKT